MANAYSWIGVRTEGALLPADFLLRLSTASKDIDGLQPTSYGLDGGEKLNEAASRAWIRLQGAWETFQRVTDNLPPEDPATSPTREKWLQPLFDALGFGRLATTKAIEVDGRSYPVSHAWGAVPIHLVGRNVDIDRRTAHVAGAAKSSPHGLVQELLNASPEHVWGIVSNGLKLRLLRDNRSMTRQAFVEFDLLAIMDGQAYADFVLLFMLLHVSRFDTPTPQQCWLEKWTRAAQEEGRRALDTLRDGVEKAIKVLGRGFLSFGNPDLKARLRAGTLDKGEYFRQLLRLVYRLLFLFVAEDRDLLHPPDASDTARKRYEGYYSTRRLRLLAGKRRGTAHGDSWDLLRFVMSRLGVPQGCPELALPALGSYLWRDQDAIPNLSEARLSNADLFSAIRHLAFTLDGRVQRAIDFRNLGPEELGSVYEALLELHPELHAEAGTFELRQLPGHERKATGSYYTHSSLISALLDSTLDPLLDKAAASPDPGAAILALKVVDPSCGSGHFLIAAAHRIAAKLATVRTRETEPSPPAVRTALRDVIGRCVYGVDLNTMAAELCKINLWLETLEPGRPLAFLESHIQVGNSLFGAVPAVLREGVPTPAFDAIEGDHKARASELREINKVHRFDREGQATLFSTFEHVESGAIRERVLRLEAEPSDDLVRIRAKEVEWIELLQSAAYDHARRLSDLWAAAFVWPKPDRGSTGEVAAAPLDRLFRDAIADLNAVPPATWRQVESLAREYSFFHWHLAFPQVFGGGDDARRGFDVVLGNPPWEMPESDDRVFFFDLEPAISAEQDPHKRAGLIAELRRSSPSTWSDWQRELRRRSGERHFYTTSGRYPTSAKGRLNSAKIFLECGMALLARDGALGMIVPSGITTNVYDRPLWRALVDRRQLSSVFDFENSRGLFPSIDRRSKFLLLTAEGGYSAGTSFRTACWLTSPEELRGPGRVYDMSFDDLARLAPETLSLPAFRTATDLHLLVKAHKTYSAFGNQSGWTHVTRLMFSSSDNRFRPVPHSEVVDWDVLPGNRRRNREGFVFVPVYEGKMFGQFDHRQADIYINPANVARQAQERPIPLAEKNDPQRFATPQHWIEAALVKRLRPVADEQEWILAFCDVTASTNERTAIASMLPLCGLTRSAPAIYLKSGDPREATQLLALMNSFALDFIVRLKVTTNHLTQGILESLPVPAPTGFGQFGGGFVLPRVLELTYTAWDLASLAAALGWTGSPFRWDIERRGRLRAELDAALFQIYGFTRAEVEHVMAAFPIVKTRDEKRYGDYRTKLQILSIYDAMHHAIDTGEPYETILDPPPADPRLCHPDRSDGAA